MQKQKVNYTVEIDAEIKKLLDKTGTIQKTLDSLGLSKKSDIVTSFSQIEKSIEKLREKTASPITSQTMFDGLDKEAGIIGKEIDRVMEAIKAFSYLTDDEKLSFLAPEEVEKIREAEKALKSYLSVKDKEVDKTKEHIEAEKELANKRKAVLDLEGKVTSKKTTVEQTEVELANYRKQAEELKKKKQALSEYVQLLKEAGKSSDIQPEKQEQINTAKSKAIDLGITGLETASLEEANQLLEEYKVKASEAGKEVTAASNRHIKASSELTELKNRLREGQEQYASAKKSVEGFNKAQESASTANAKKRIEDLAKALKSFGVNIDGIDLTPTEENIKKLSDAVEHFRQAGVDKASISIDNLAKEFNELKPELDATQQEINSSREAFTKLDEAASQRAAFAERLKQFVGLQGGALLARQALTNAISVIKELDATMTEMAVVTDLSVGDYWNQLPEYAKQASELGVSINSAYKAATLYYQQGLKSNEVTKMSAETLKMARIAGLSAEDATNKMTAALRGFNMELNETSAQRVADVYSELAAITASDVKEISSAMTKTASIASSAGMEFETTAAFLSQIIETTRESAETAGTALKTVIARFQELKKDPAEIGEVDGEVVDANKIETALRSVGVSLRDSSGQFRELDDVFLELSSKWDSLDKNTQRYIATIAAGSRQQSRFIAMMSDYGRTQELVAAANNSTGASNEQFQKTMDSLQSKLEKLKNAWDAFTMDILNSDLLKAGVDILTAILETINKLTNAFGNFSGAAKIALLTAALYAGDKALKVFWNTLNAVNKDGQRINGIFDALGAVGKSAAEGVNSKFEILQNTFKTLSTQIQDLTGNAKTFREAYSNLNTKFVEKMAPHLESEQVQNIRKKVSKRKEDKENKRKAKEKKMEESYVDASFVDEEETPDTKKPKAPTSHSALPTDVSPTVPTPPGFSPTVPTSAGIVTTVPTVVSSTVPTVAQQVVSATPATPTVVTSAVPTVVETPTVVSPVEKIPPIIEKPEQETKQDIIKRTTETMASAEGSEAEAIKKIEEAQQRLIEIDNERTKSIEKQREAIKSKGAISKSTVGSEESRQKRIAKLDEMEVKSKGEIVKATRKEAAQKGVITKQSKKIEDAQKKQQKALLEQATARGLTNEQTQTALKLQQTGLAQSASEIGNLAGLTAGETAQAAALGGLTSQKIADYQATMIASGMTENEINQRMALITQTYAQAGATALNTTATEANVVAEGADAVATTADVVATNADTAATNANTAATNANTAGEIANTGAKTIGLVALWEKIKAGVMNIASLAGQAAMQWALNVAEYAGCPPTLLLAAAILILVAAVVAAVAIIALFVAGIKAAQENTLDAQIEKTREQLKQFNEAAEEAKNRLDAINSALDEYKKTQNVFEDLVEGTKEWNKALVEANTQVLSLLQTYSELSKYLINDKGRLQITDEGWEALQAQQEQIIRNTALAQQRTQLKLSNLENEKAIGELYDKMGGFQASKASGMVVAKMGSSSAGAASSPMLTAGQYVGPLLQTTIAEATEEWGVMGDVLTGFAVSATEGPLAAFAGALTEHATEPIEALGKEDLGELAEKMLEKGLTLEDSSKEEVGELYREIFNTKMPSEFYNSLMENKEGFYELGASLHAAKEQLEAYSDSLIDNATARSGVEDSEWAGAIGSNLKITTDGKEDQAAFETKTKEIKKEYSKDEAMEQYAAQMGYTYKNGKMYSTQDKTKLNSDSEIEVDMDVVYEQLAESAIVDEKASQMASINSALEKNTQLLDEDKKSELKRILSGDVDQITTSDIENIEKAGGIENYLKEGFNIDASQLDLNFEGLNTQALEKVKAENSKTKLETADTLGLSDPEQLNTVFSGLTQSGAKSMQTQFENLTNFYGQDMGQDIFGLISGMSTGEGAPLSAETQELLNSQLASIDWSDASQIQGITETIAELGNISEEERKALEGFELAMITTAKATKQIDVAALKEMAKNLTDITKAVKDGKRDFSQEEHDSLKAAGVDMSQFVETADGFRYLGTVADLIKDTSIAASKKLEETKTNFENLQANSKQAMNNLMESQKRLEEIQNQQVVAEEEKLTGWEALAQWFRGLWEKIKAIFNSIKEAVGRFYQEKIVPVFNSIAEAAKKFWDIIVGVANKIGEAMTNLKNWIGEALVGVINFFIRLANKVGANIKEISFKKEYFKGMKSSAEIEHDNEVAKAEEEKKKREEELNTAMTEMNDGLKAYSSSILSLADNVDVGVLVEYQQDNEKDKREWQEYAAQLAQEYGDWEKVPESIRQNWQAVMDSYDDIDTKFNQALQSKALGIEGLEPQVARFQKALEDGNTLLADKLKRDLVNAISEATAKDILVTQMENVEELAQKVNEMGIGAKEATPLLERMAYHMNFKDIDKGVEFLTENFDDLQLALDGDLEAWERLQKAMAKGLGIDLDHLGAPEVESEVVEYIKSHDTASGDQTLDSLIGSGMFTVVQKVATEDKEVADINYADGEANLGEGKTKKVKKGDTYWTIEATSSDVFADAFNAKGESDHETEYTQLYVLNEELNRLVEERNKAEERYQDLLEDENASMEEIIAARKEVLNLIEQEKIKNQKIKKVADDNLHNTYNEAVAKNDKFANYVSVNENGEVIIDESYAYTNDLSDKEREELDEYISLMLEYSETSKEAKDAIEEGNKTLKDIKKEAKGQTLDAFDRTKDALLKTRQDEIDKLSEINDSINDAQSNFLEAMQKQIDATREQRENEKTEEDITDKYNKLAYLQSDTSGGNALEILSLQKEIEDAEEEYQDTLIDQALTKLQDANEEAAQQRERQISLLESQLEAYENSKEIWADVGNLVWGAAEAYTAGTPLDQTEWYQLLESSEDWKYKNPYELESTKTELNSLFSGILTTGGYVTADDLDKTDESIDNVVTYFKSKDPLPVTEKEDGTQNGYESPIGEALKKKYLGLAQDHVDKTHATSVSNNKGVSDLYGDYLVEADAAGVSAMSYDEFVNSVKAWESVGSNETGAMVEDKDRAYELSLQRAQEFIDISTANGVDLNASSAKNNSTLSAYYQDYLKNTGYSSSAKTYEEFLSELEYNILTSDSAVAKAQRKVVGHIVKNPSKWKSLEELKRNVEVSDIYNDYYADSHYSGISYNDFMAPFEDILKRYSKLTKLKTGGVVGFTGPAWLDGTTTNPEMVLNPQQTKDIQETVSILNTEEGEALSTQIPTLERLKESVPKLKKFKTGGIADFTGPAWLDGTTTNPEMVLNQQQTEDIQETVSVLNTEEGKSLSAQIPALERLKESVPKLKKFKTGGLADFTGPAWLDGTPSKPEYILNSKQTEKFFTLIDVLEGFEEYKDKKNETSRGDNYYDIDINVEKLENDYDIEQVADKIKRMIHEDASYRNVNAINLIR